MEGKLNLHHLFMNASDGERLFHELVSPEWHAGTSLKRLHRKFLSSQLQFLLIPHFLKPAIAGLWYEELQSAPHCVERNYFRMQKWPRAWKAHYRGKIEARWDWIEEKYLIVGQLVQSLFLSDYFSRFLGRLVGAPDSLTYLGGHHKRMGVGDWSNPHDDTPSIKEITVIYYATKGWKKAYHGRLLIGPRKAPLFRLVPGFNKLFVFKSPRQIYHGIEPIRRSAGKRIRYGSVFWFHEKNHRVKV